MKIPCGFCQELVSRVRLHRVGNRLLCGRCFKAIRNAPTNSPGGVATGDLQDFFNRATLFTVLGIAGKALMFVPFFLWARNSDIGSAALRGAVWADVFTWGIFAALEWEFRRSQITTGAVFEAVLVFFYLNRGTLFEITGDIESDAMSGLFFFAVLIGKTGCWTAGHILEVTGVRERASQ